MEPPKLIKDTFEESIVERPSSSRRSKCIFTMGIATFNTLQSVLYERLFLSQRVLYRLDCTVLAINARHGKTEDPVSQIL